MLATAANRDRLKRMRYSIMTIYLSKDLEQIVNDAVRAGLYAREDDVLRDALTRLKETLPKSTKTPAKKSKSAKPAPKKKKRLIEVEFDQHLLNIGLMSQLPNTDADFDDPDDEPITIKGEPLSETVIRERR
jgi:Arc/MetJ-type ribon-helix-helix transcriptional regulator